MKQDCVPVRALDTETIASSLWQDLGNVSDTRRDIIPENALDVANAVKRRKLSLQVTYKFVLFDQLLRSEVRHGQGWT